MKAQLRRLVRYGSVSAVSTVVSLSVLGLLVAGRVMAPGWANVVATAAGTGPSFELNRRWVWNKTGRRSFAGEIVPFWALSIAGILFALFTASLAQHFSNTHHLQHLARTVVVVGANVAAFGILWVLKFLIFNRLFAEIADKELGTDAGAQAEAEAEAEA